MTRLRKLFAHSEHTQRMVLLALVSTVLLLPMNSCRGTRSMEAPGSTGPFQATGIKVCEVTSTTATVWTRLTLNPRRMGDDRPLPTVRYRDLATGELQPRSGGSRRNREPTVEYPEGVTVDTIEGAAPGSPGEVRVQYRRAGADDWEATGWQPVDSARDFTRQLHLDDLTAGARYELRVEARKDADSPAGSRVDGRFRTAPLPDSPARVVFTVSTGQAYGDQDAVGGGYRIYPSMLRVVKPDFFVHTGDIVYFDRLAKTLPLARWHWARTYSLPTNVEFHRQVGSYFIKDDHDTWMNDCWPAMKSPYMGEFTFRQGQEVFLEQVGMGEKTYRTRRWGKDLQIWLVEGRDFRSPNDMPDGPEKTIWGAEQKEWFRRTVDESDAAFRILISPTPLVGPDRQNKNDNHSNKGFQHEGDELREFISGRKNLFVVCGDRHWQYVSVHAESGVREYSCGPASNAHARGWSNAKRLPEHRYLNVTGGFLAVCVDREGGRPVITFRHHDVDGKVLHEDRLEAE